MAQFKGHPPAGKALPNDWQTQAKSNAMQADAAYLHQLQNAWRGNRDNETLIQAARLTNHPQPAPKRNDARSDARFDGAMRLVLENEMMELWRNDDGTTVQIMKRKK